MPKILLTNYYNVAPLRIVRDAVPDGFELLSLDRPGRSAIMNLIGDADYLLAGGRAKIDREMISFAKKLKMVQRTGVGLDSLDLDALREMGIPLQVNPGVNAISVAEHTIMLILGVLRRINEADAGMRAGKWEKHDLGIRCNDLHGKTVGLIGFGNIGTHVAALLHPFGVHILCTDKQPAIGDIPARACKYVTLDELLKSSDVISLHCALTEETEGLIGREAIMKMKRGVVIINTARGRLVNEDALVEGLVAAHIRGAGLDVYGTEPLPAESPLRRMQQVLLTPHIAGISADSFKIMMGKAMDGIAKFHERTQIDSR